MAPKKADVIDNPPVASSSEEEVEESGSSGEESESSAEDSKKDDSSDDEPDLQSKNVVSVASKKPESGSEESYSDSDSDREPLNSVVTKPKTQISGSASALPESSQGKRSLKQADDEPKKKMKTDHVKKPKTTDEEVKKISGEEAKKMFQRLFSETDEIAMLQGYLDFTSTRGDPSENMDAFCEYVKPLINFNPTRSQIVTKLQRCKKKFVNSVKNALKKGKTEDKIKFSKDLDQQSFELSRKIWGIDGVLRSKSRKKSKETKSLPPLPSIKKQEETEKPKTSVVNAHLSSSKEMALFFKAENPSVFSLDEFTITSGWDMVEDGPKKREMEEKLKKLKSTQVELCLQRIGLVDMAAKTILKDNASS